MPTHGFRIHISDFCQRLYRLLKAEELRLDEDSDKVHEGSYDKPHFYWATADYICRRAGLPLKEVHTYIHRAGRGSQWGWIKRDNGEEWPDITWIAQAMSAFSQTPDMDELVTRFLEDYPHEAAEMGLHRVANGGEPGGTTEPAGSVVGQQQDEACTRVSAEEARRRAEVYIRQHDFPGVNALAKQCECSPSAIRKAIAQSETLQRAQASHRLRKAKPAARAQTANDPSWQAQVDEALRHLIEYAPESERAKLHTPDVRDHLAKMEPDALALLVDDARKQHEQRKRTANRAPGRAQVASS